MGSGVWSTNVYDAAKKYRRAAGKSAFSYSDSGARTVHPALDPRDAMREARDSAEHPQSTPIAVLFDVTGSMGHVPRTLQEKLPQLLGLLQRQGYARDPQIMFGAIGDATCDRVPLQVGQFESDNRMDEDLGRIVLEGGGGGQMMESYELALYFMARHTATDSWDRRGRRGYLFIIGDELAYAGVKHREVTGVIGDRIGEDIPVRRIVDEVTERWDTYYLLPAGSHYARNSKVLDFWRDLLGQNAVTLDDLDAVCETIALTIGLGEEAIELEEGLRDLDRAGSTATATVSKALAPLRAGRQTVASTLPAATRPATRGVTRL
ncbi:MULTISPECIES: hypothetical protein [Micromonospora]|uniref:VWA domain-containing protein n=1 Tax=Micromonospora yangpuensis TaxID=683228 RepID=A0A1C6TXY1_9ACTN|nr:hypothetical protein [Micromonospora yangpuensis]GGM02473.1 hypothetical protein GCM10012279_20230 [Micromonospora yangpuensis]SCL46597.1 hypothetical protein GA0070617_0323 [Micromonospora yangpuensis]